MRRISVSHRAKIVFDVVLGSSRRHDRVRACSPSRRRDLRRNDTVPIHTCPRRCAFPVWVEGNQDEVPFTENRVARLLGLSSYGDTQVQVRNCILDNSFVRDSISPSRQIRRRFGYWLLPKKRLLEGALEEEICYDSAPLLSSLFLAGLLPRGR